MGAYDWQVRTFTQSIPNPEWNVVVTHVPTGMQRQESGKGDSRQAATRLRSEIEAALRFYDAVITEHE